MPCVESLTELGVVEPLHALPRDRQWSLLHPLGMNDSTVVPNHPADQSLCFALIGRARSSWPIKLVCTSVHIVQQRLGVLANLLCLFTELVVVDGSIVQL